VEYCSSETELDVTDTSELEENSGSPIMIGKTLMPSPSFSYLIVESGEEDFPPKNQMKKRTSGMIGE